MLALKIVVFTIVVPGSVMVWIPYLMVAGQGQRAHFDPGGWVATAAIAMGAVVYLKCVWDFAVAGQGTPAPIDPPRRLVVRGFYRHVRNPMYLGIVTTLLGEALLFHGTNLLLYAGVLWLGFYLFVRFYEEPALRKKFGEQYADYCRAVPRWRPRLKAWAGI